MLSTCAAAVATAAAAAAAAAAVAAPPRQRLSPAIASSSYCCYDRLAVLANARRHLANEKKTRMWSNAQRDGRPAVYRWRPLFNAAKFG